MVVKMSLCCIRFGYQVVVGVSDDCETRGGHFACIFSQEAADSARVYISELRPFCCVGVIILGETPTVKKRMPVSRLTYVISLMALSPQYCISLGNDGFLLELVSPLLFLFRVSTFI